MNVYFVTGIDTDTGKSYATGYLARLWNEEGQRTITQKLIQTGNVGYSEDIDLHRQIMQTPHTEEDKLGLTMPQLFSYPASPHLAARLDGRPVDVEKITRSTEELSKRYDAVLLEGAGGVMVPMTDKLLTIDYVAERKYPIILVTSGRLGSINHTLLSLEAIRNRGLELAMVAYNLYPKQKDNIIQQDTANYLRTHLAKEFPKTRWLEIPILALTCSKKT